MNCPRNSVSFRIENFSIKNWCEWNFQFSVEVQNFVTLVLGILRVFFVGASIFFGLSKTIASQVEVLTQVELWADNADQNYLWSLFQDWSDLWPHFPVTNDLHSDFPDIDSFWSDRTRTMF